MTTQAPAKPLRTIPRERKITVEELEEMFIDPFAKTKEYDDKVYDENYKILVYSIKNHRIMDPTPFGMIDRGRSSLEFGFFVGVKECSPREDFNESKEVIRRLDTEKVIEDYQTRYKVDESEIYDSTF